MSHHLRVTLAGCLLLAVAGTAPAAIMNMHMTDGGGDETFSSRVTTADAPWHLFGQPMAPAPAAEEWMFVEPGMGNEIPEAQGQLLNLGWLGGRVALKVLDRLAWIPVPQLLYLDSYSGPVLAPAPPAFAGHMPQTIGGDMGIFGEPSSTPTLTTALPLPEPATALALLAALGTGALRRPAQR